jgi:hypothetical protein
MSKTDLKAAMPAKTEKAKVEESHQAAGAGAGAAGPLSNATDKAVVYEKQIMDLYDTYSLGFTELIQSTEGKVESGGNKFTELRFAHTKKFYSITNQYVVGFGRGADPRPFHHEDEKRVIVFFDFDRFDAKWKKANPELLGPETAKDWLEIFSADRPVWRSYIYGVRSAAQLAAKPASGTVLHRKADCGFIGDFAKETQSMPFRFGAGTTIVIACAWDAYLFERTFLDSSKLHGEFQVEYVAFPGTEARRADREAMEDWEKIGQRHPGRVKVRQLLATDLKTK